MSQNKIKTQNSTQSHAAIAKFHFHDRQTNRPRYANIMSQ